MYRQRLGWMVVVCFVLLLSAFSAQAPTSQAQGLPTPTPPMAMCNGLPATIYVVGDRLKRYGTPADDVIVMIGRGNNVYGGYGADTICMIGDKNAVFAQEGNDFISFTGIDNLGFGGSGVDTCVGTELSNRFINCEP